MPKQMCSDIPCPRKQPLAPRGSPGGEVRSSCGPGVTLSLPFTVPAPCAELHRPTRVSLEQKLGSFGTRSSCHLGSFACLKQSFGGVRKRGKELLLSRGASVLPCSCCFTTPAPLKRLHTPLPSPYSASNTFWLGPEPGIVV